MLIKHQSLESVLQESRAAVVVEITSVSPLQDDGYWRSIEFYATPTQTLCGDEQSDRQLACRYSQGQPHHRGDMRVSPLVTGSGLEFGIKPGDRVIVLLGDLAGKAEIIKVLRIEPLSSTQIIQKRPAAQAGQPGRSLRRTRRR